ncbi:AraC family transcriptional regulator [Rubrivivax benzoatilyticus]|uniref:AraC family transcriptional regulator n=1 Tax=Rubrivivax benzoatilyticus TaxID=316997 RepID=A0ABX0I3V5_9BURK|nr:helix-turn-helix transcriptional regulator [Rubrivivax benzoatilyticus]EGJ10902.1 AraC family transcriptional regulator [Rubrivivax benzoatilyticus JA2 = ATCC BAA-35]NHL00270.1 AraC family transcriptional regulator [Rubrivivax benzoatilyticus]NHL26135.1 AraC family transcriptional regulator [Rubrivivax benzoatilyticus]
MLSSRDLEWVPRPVVALADEYPARFVDPRHSHARAQLLYAAAGVMSVVTDDASFVIPPQRAIWMPAGVFHEVTCRSAVSVRTLYVEADDRLPGDCRVLEVSELLRALILEAMTLPREYDHAGRDGRIVQLILDSIAAPAGSRLCAPMPHDARLRQVCQALIEDPTRNDSLDDWAERACMSRRTFTRAFREQTGMSLAEWRQHVRLLEALARLACGQPVTTIAFDVGYESPSAFTAAFQRAFGVPPSRYLR